jgi:hypothetical protein
MNTYFNKIDYKKIFSLLVVFALLLNFLPSFPTVTKANTPAGESNEPLNFIYDKSIVQDMEDGDSYHYVQNDLVKAVISSKVGGNNAQGSFQKGWPVDFVLKDSMKETLDWTQFILSDSIHSDWSVNGQYLNLENIKVVDGDKIVASGSWQGNAKIAAQATYQMLPDAPIMKITLNLTNNDSIDYEGFFNYQVDPDISAQKAYVPGAGWNPGLLTSGWTGNYVYDGDQSASDIPANGIAWYENSPVAINAPGFIFGAWFNANVKAGESKDITFYHITDYASGDSGYSEIASWADKLPNLDDEIENIPEVSGQVVDKVTGEPIPGVAITARNINSDIAGIATSDEEGKYDMLLPEGTYTLTTSRLQYNNGEGSVEINQSSNAYTIDFSLEPVTVWAGKGKKLNGSLAQGTEEDIVMENQKLAMTIADTFIDGQMKNAKGKPVDMSVQGLNDGIDWMRLPYLSLEQPQGSEAWNTNNLINESVSVVENTSTQSVVQTSGAYAGMEGLQVGTTYTIKSGEEWVNVESNLTNTTNEPITLWVGDVIDNDDGSQVSYVPGVGEVSIGYGAQQSYTPASPWFGQFGSEPQAYGIMYDGKYAEEFNAYGNSSWIMSQKQVTIAAGETFKLTRDIIVASTEGFTAKGDAITAIYEKRLSEQTGIETSFNVNAGEILNVGEEVTATLTVKNNSDAVVEGVTAKLELSGDLLTEDELDVAVGPISPNSAKTIDWKVKTTDGGRGQIKLQVMKDDKLLTEKREYLFTQGEGWYAGDNHSHSRWSDGSGTIQENFASARNKGLDFLTATDHNTIKQKDDVAKENSEKFVALFGEEITTRQGHSLAYNIDSLIDWKQSPQEYIDDTRASNNGQGLHFIAHPYYPGLEWEDWSVTNYNGIEVWNGFYPPKHPVNAQAFAKWDELNNAGKHKLGISNSDAHNPGKIGNNYIRAKLDELSKEEVYKTLRNGTFYGTNGPELGLKVNEQLMGSDVEVPKTGKEVNIDLEAFSEKGLTKIRLLKNGEVIENWTINGNDFSKTIKVQSKPRDFFRMELEGNNGMFAFSNPIWIKEVISISTIQTALDEYVKSGDVSGPLVPQLTNRLNQVEHHLNKQHTNEAVKHMKDFVKHMENKPMNRHISDEAKKTLEDYANRFINGWS